MALMHCGACVSVQTLGRRWDAAHVIVYLPFLFQMAHSKKNVLLDIFSLSFPPFPHSFLTSSISPVAQHSVCTWFHVQNTWHEVRGNVLEPGKQTGT